MSIIALTKFLNVGTLKTLSIILVIGYLTIAKLSSESIIEQHELNAAQSADNITALELDLGKVAEVNNANEEIREVQEASNKIAIATYVEYQKKAADIKLKSDSIKDELSELRRILNTDIITTSPYLVQEAMRAATVKAYAELRAVTSVSVIDILKTN